MTVYTLPIKGSYSPDNLRDEMRKAVRQKDKTNLEKLIQKAEAARLPELSFDLARARDTLENLGGGRGG